MAQKGKNGLPDLYGLLGVREEADEVDIKKAYRVLVLKWHPDKNPSDRQQAEEQIRAINAAYGTLSNPAKRERYDLQRCALDKQRRGVAPRVPKDMPKVEAPKEFFMQPLGHLDKFVRYVKKKVAVQARHDVQVGFDDFFQGVKMSMWWLPDVKNSCRIRALGSKAKGDKKAIRAGMAGGLNLSFRIKPGYESEVILAAALKGKRGENVDFVAKASPEYEGAVRFETACRRGHYLTFFPPTDLRVVSLLCEQPGKILDFVITDFAEAVGFRDLQEVLLPVGLASPGEWVPLARFRDCQDVRSHFEKVLKKPMWDDQDFAAYFEGHWAEWDYRSADHCARLRPAEERLGEVLRGAAALRDVANAVDSAKEELWKVPVCGAVNAIVLLAEDLPQGKDTKQETNSGPSMEELVALRRKLLAALRTVLTGAPREALAPVPFRQLLDAAERVPALVGEEPTPDLLDQRNDSVRLLAQMAAAKISPCEDDEEVALTFDLSVEDLARLLRLPGLATRDKVLLSAVRQALASASRPALLEVIRPAVSRGYTAVAAAAVEAAMVGLVGLAPDEAAAAFRDLAEAGGSVEGLATALAAGAAGMGAAALAAALLAFCSRAAVPEGLRQVAEDLAGRAPLQGLGGPLLLGLAVAAARVLVLEPVFGAVVEAAAASADDWPLIDVIQLLLATSKGRDRLPAAAKEVALAKAETLLKPELGNLKAADVLKVVLAVSSHGPCALAEAAAREVVVRLSDFSAAQLLLITQALASGLQPGHAALTDLVGAWPRLLEGLPAPGATRPGSDGQLSGDQLAKLVGSLEPALAAADAKPKRQFVEAVATSLLQTRAAQASEAGRAQLKGLLDAGSLRGCARRCKLLSVLKKRARHASRSPSRDKEEAAADRTKKKRKSK